MQTATATVAIILLSGCSPINFFNGGVYYKEAQIVERKVPVKCNVKKCEEPIDMKHSAFTGQCLRPTTNASPHSCRYAQKTIT